MKRTCQRERIISCISENILYIYLTADKKCLADWVIHDLITRKMWFLNNDIFENPSLSVQTHLINICTVLPHLAYSWGLLGLSHVFNSWKSQPSKSLVHHTLLVYYSLYCSVAIYAVLMHSIMLYCHMCCFIAIHAVLSPFCCNLRCFVAKTWLVQNTRFPRHFWGGSQ